MTRPRTVMSCNECRTKRKAFSGLSLFTSRLLSALLDLGLVAYPCVPVPHVLAFGHFSSPVGPFICMCTFAGNLFVIPVCDYVTHLLV